MEGGGGRRDSGIKMTDSPSLVALVLALFMLLGYIITTSVNGCANVARKAKLALTGVVHMALSKDKKLSKSPLDAGLVKLGGSGNLRGGGTGGASPGTPNLGPAKRVIFIRHGESEWNEVFNRGFGPSFLVRLVKALFREAMLLTSRDSVFFDSPLSDTGIRQTQELLGFIHSPPKADNPIMADALALLGGGHGLPAEKDSCVLVTSNLRRAIVTGLIALWERFRVKGNTFEVHSGLQEMTFNVDGISLLEKGEVPDGSLAKELGAEVKFGSRYNMGTKPLKYTGVKRMDDFCRFAVSRDESTVVAVGHSLYFRSFFRTYLPQSCSHLCKAKKMVNCGVVAFDLRKGTHPRGGGKVAYAIDPKSVTVVYGGFK